MAQLTYSRQLPIEKPYDLIVAGGGPSGVAAAVAAGRAGLRVALIERNGCLGGLGVRETRRIVGRCTLNEADFIARAVFEDEIGRYNYPIDIHRSSPSLEDHEALVVEFTQSHRLGVGESYGIPYRCLVPQGIDNLLVSGRCISTDRKVQGSIRVMPCCFITGQAAGTAAALCKKQDVAPKELDADLLRGTLREQGAHIP